LQTGDAERLSANPTTFKIGSIQFSPSNTFLQAEIAALRTEVELLRAEVHAWKRYTDTLAAIVDQLKESFGALE
jgi:hypothetical protein